MASEREKIPYRSRGVILAFAALLAVASGSAYWIISWIVRGDEPFPITILYRFGDTDYLSLFYAVSRLEFHEFITQGIETPRLVPFPIGLSLVYAIPIMILGDHGFPVADVLITLSRIAVSILVGRVIFKNFSAAVVAGIIIFVLTGPLPLLSRVWELFSHPLWDMRNLRPFVTGLFLLSLVLSTYRFRRRLEAGLPSSAPAILHGALIGLTAQGDLHLAIIATFATAIVFLALLVKSPSNWRLFLAAGSKAGFTCLVVMLPMLVQLWNVHPDVLRRLGQIPLSRLAPPFLLAAAPWPEICPLGLVYAVLARWRVGGEAAAQGRTLLAVIVLFSVMSVLALPLSVVILGRGVQIYHFPFRASGFVVLGYTVAGLIVGQAVLDRLGVLKSARAAAAIAATAAFLAAALHLSFLFYRSLEVSRLETQQRAWDSGWTPIAGYRPGLDDLWRELSRPEYRDRLVLATFDQQLGMLWATRDKHRLWLPDPFLSTVPDAAIEHRLIAFAQAVGMTADDFDRHVGEEYFYNHLLNDMKWHASYNYKYSPDAEYSADELKMISRKFWSTVAPNDERRRLDDLFAKPTTIDGRLDLIVLERGTSLGDLTGPKIGFDKVYENSSFTIWESQKQ